MTTTHRPKTAPLNLAALVAPLPPIVLPNGTEHQCVFTAHAATQYKEIRRMLAALHANEAIDEIEAENLIDECVQLVLPTASADDLASLGMRVELKLTILAAASGRVDEVMHALHAASAGNAPEAEAAPRSSLDMTSAP